MNHHALHERIPEPQFFDRTRLLPRGRAQNVNVVGTLIDVEILTIGEMNLSSRARRFTPRNLVRVNPNLLVCTSKLHQKFHPLTPDPGLSECSRNFMSHRR
jgi:hypothetical protein